MRVLPESGRIAIGEYLAVAELGEGAMGRVLLARAPGGRLVAVKRVHAHLLADQEFRARFRSEVAACRKVASAYAVPVIDADTEADEPWFASAFTPGPTLAGVLAAGITLPEPALSRLAAGLAAALADFEAAGVIHRDLKPSNILLAADGPRVLDFGIARPADPLDGPGLTRTGWLLGTPAYMSPEQARAKPLTAASDVFSLGSVLVAAHTGTAPFDDPETLQAMYNVVHADPDLSGLPPRSRRIVAKCLAKDPRRRPTATGLLELIGEPPEAERPWPGAVHDLITAHNAELADLVGRHPDRTTVIDAGETMRARLAGAGETLREADSVVAVGEPVVRSAEVRADATEGEPAGPATDLAAGVPVAAEGESAVRSAEVQAVAAEGESAVRSAEVQPDTAAEGEPAGLAAEPGEPEPTGRPTSSGDEPIALAAQPATTRPKPGAAAAGSPPLPPAPKPSIRKRRSPLVAAAMLAAIAVIIAVGGLFGNGFGNRPNDSDNTATQAADDSRDRDFENAYEDFEPDEPDSDTVTVSVGDLPEPCSHVDDEIVSRFGLRDGDSDTTDAWKSCRWLATPDDTAEVAGINLGFATGPYSDDEGGEAVSVEGITGATVHSDEKAGSCMVQWPVSFGYILVTGAHDEEDRTELACDLARDFAEAALPGLPD